MAKSMAQLQRAIALLAMTGTLTIGCSVGFSTATSHNSGEASPPATPDATTVAQLRRRQMASSPACETVGGTYKNANGDLATITAESGGASNESRVTLYFREQNYQPVLTFTYFTPNGYGISTTSDGNRSIYYADLGTWRVAMFGEGSPLWYGEPQIGVSDSIWFQVSCNVDLDAAKERSLPTVSP